MNIKEIEKRISYDPINGKLYRTKDKHGEPIKREIKTIANNGYICFSFDRKVYLAHRYIWFLCNGGDHSKHIDHINGNRLDNRLSNLRLVNPDENNRNLKKNKKNTSGLMGVFWAKDAGKWRSVIYQNNKPTHLGYSDCFFEACCLRKSAEVNFNYHENHGRTS